MSWRKTERLMSTIKHYASFPATGVSLRQMVQFGERPSVGASALPIALPAASSADPDVFSHPTGTMFRASQFLAEELPIRLAHRVQELESLPDGLNEMPSVKKVQDWYAQSFEVSCQPPNPPPWGDP
jgi:pyruvate dehydrogenase kinase 2/3/4